MTKPSELRRIIEPYAGLVQEIITRAVELPTPELAKLHQACEAAKVTWAWDAYNAARLLKSWVSIEIDRRATSDCEAGENRVGCCFKTNAR